MKTITTTLSRMRGRSRQPYEDESKVTGAHQQKKNPRHEAKEKRQTLRHPLNRISKLSLVKTNKMKFRTWILILDMSSRRVILMALLFRRVAKIKIQ